MNCGQNHFGTWGRSRGGEVDGGWRRWVIHRKFNFTSSCILVLSQSLIVKVIFPWNHQISAKCKHHILNKGRRRQKDLLSNGSSLFYFLKWGNWKMLPICIRFHEKKKERFMYDISTYFFLLFFQAVFERLVDIICDKMSESLDSDPTLNTNKGTRLDNAQPSSMNCNC